MSNRMIKAIEILLAAAAMAIASGTSNVAAEEIPIEVQADTAELSGCLSSVCSNQADQHAAYDQGGAAQEVDAQGFSQQ